jgi:L-alanine-DL-glutamate epimerase-like enolase superfamily enzyme
VAEAAWLSVCLHGQSVTGVTDCAQHQLGTSLPNLTDGNQIMHQLLEEDILATTNLELRNGKLELISGPGLGFELDWDAVGRAAERYRHDSAGQFSRER